MGKLREEYDSLIEQRRKIIEQLTMLEESETVQQYIELKKQNEELYNQQLSLYRDVKMEEYASCSHILVCSKLVYDRYEGRTCEWCGCIKCGLDTSVLDSDYPLGLQKIMYDYLKKSHLHSLNIQEIKTDVICDMDLAQVIYAKIKSVYPNIDDETARKYFEIALDNIRNIKVSDERKENRAKRLSLDSKFKKWDISYLLYS